MSATCRFNVDLPDDLVRAVRARVDADEFESFEAAVCEGLRRLSKRNRAEDDWLRTAISARAQALDEGRLHTKSPDEVRRSLSNRAKARDQAA